MNGGPSDGGEEGAASMKSRGKRKHDILEPRCLVWEPLATLST